ncbi:HD-GYP domain-containing protein [Ammoniphilus sp. CFH 90114]|uniref:HD-GYP domain-containing protein n=1 Tax=Ammoniphilus sp. CFH 90114 TaxID=2493665 RepID=UPI00100F6272|nr:HD-GYP domain-containing protein [Ammoniphilus sp. CFH 90114]RXT04140.1 HD-GYP domain-containing protein [Ammoniphilus sp. CFH 90114]
MTFDQRDPSSSELTRSTLFRKGQAIEQTITRDLGISLLASGDGTEVIHHKLNAGGRWALVPEQGWDALEHIYILSGHLKWLSSEKEVVLKPGDSFSSHPVQEHFIFIAETTVEFLYISSRPVFHHYSKTTKELMDLAVTIEEKDGYTSDHCHRIREFSMMVGEAMQLSPNQMHALNYGSFFHDIGKVKIPESILLKPSRLTNEEYDIIKLHTVYGRELLESTNIPHLVSAGVIVEQHHERLDGSGYPKGLKGNEISIEACIVAVVDSYDAMTTDRVYQKGRSKEEALQEILRFRGSFYHPDVVDTFLAISDRIDREGR